MRRWLRFFRSAPRQSEPSEFVKRPRSRSSPKTECCGQVAPERLGQIDSVSSLETAIIFQNYIVHPYIAIWLEKVLVHLVVSPRMLPIYPSAFESL